MPNRLDTSKQAKSVHHRKDGYHKKFYNPHSPFQRLISSGMERKQLSFRALAQKIDVAQATIWVWLHNEKGIPAPRSFDPKVHIEKLSRALNIPTETIEKSLDLSKLEFSQGLIPEPAPLLDAFADYISILEQMTTTRVDRMKVLNLARRLYAGATMEIEESDPVPPPKKKPSAKKAVKRKATKTKRTK